MPDHPPKILVLGAYGFIGAALVHALRRAGHPVRGLGRDARRMVRADGLEWVQGDLRAMTRPGDWAQALDGARIIVNAAGSLQDGGCDDLAAVHADAIIAMTTAARQHGIQHIVQISAVGVAEDAPVAFLSTKASGDQAIREAGIPYTILRPGLVLGETVYGGTALLRMLAAVPWVQPLVASESPVQVISLDALCEAVLTAVQGQLPNGTEADLVAPEPVTLAELVAGIRAWLGFAPAKTRITVPGFATRAIAHVANLLGRLGWRPPLRSTALKVIETGVTGDPEPWRNATGQSLPGPAQILGTRRATLQDRWHARLALLFPVIMGTLAVFWLASGTIGLVWHRDATAPLTDAGISQPIATALVLAGSVADILLGLGVLGSVEIQDSHAA